jgi:hypothetical protein
MFNAAISVYKLNLVYGQSARACYNALASIHVQVQGCKIAAIVHDASARLVFSFDHLGLKT